MYFLLCDSVIKGHRGFLYNKFTRLGFGTFVFIQLKGTVRVILSKPPDKDKGFKGIIVNQSLLAFFAYNYAFSFFEQKLWGRGGAVCTSITSSRFSFKDSQVCSFDSEYGTRYSLVLIFLTNIYFPSWDLFFFFHAQNMVIVLSLLNKFIILIFNISDTMWFVQFIAIFVSIAMTEGKKNC